MTKRATFTQADVERALRAAMAVGCAHPTVDIRPDGTLRLLTAEQEAKPLSALEAWEQANGHAQA